MSKSFNVTNYKGVRQIELSPSGRMVVIAGANGAGKSSFIDAITELFDPEGAKLTPKPIREGADEALAEYVDEALGVRVRRVWKKNGTAGTLAVETLDGAKYSKPSQVVAELTGGLIFDPVKWLNMDEKKQRDALLEKVDLPFDPAVLANKKRDVEDRRRDAGREVKRLEGALASLLAPAEGIPVVEVAAQDLLDEIQAAQQHNAGIQRANDFIVETGKQRAGIRARIEALLAEIEALKAEDANLAARTDDALKVAERAPVDLAPLQSKLSEVDEINKAVRAKCEWEKIAAELEQARKKHAAEQAALDRIEAEKVAGLAAAEFPVAGLSIDDDGVTYNGIPFGQVNSAMRLRVAFVIATSGDPKLRLVIIKDGDLLDGESLQVIAEIAEEREYMVLVERDRDESRALGFTIVDGELAEAVA